MTLSDTTTETLPTPTNSPLRVVLLLELHDDEGARERFLNAYEQMRHQVAEVPGHIRDQLCQSIEEPSQWLITSEWESPAPYLKWVNSAEHLEMVRPMHTCVRGTRPLRYSVLRETSTSGAEQGVTTTNRPAAAGRSASTRVRHALTFTVRPGTEREVAEILAAYPSPEPRVDAITRLHRTSVFLRGNRVVRAVEIEGDLGAALRHIASQPQIRATEEALNPYLEEERDLSDPASARDFFMRAALPEAFHVVASHRQEGNLHRRAMLYPVRVGAGEQAARLIARQDELAGSDPRHPIAASSLFLSGNVLVRVVDATEELAEAPAAAVGVGKGREAAELASVLDLGEAHEELATDSGLRRFLADCDLRPLTDRYASTSH